MFSTWLTALAFLSCPSIVMVSIIPLTPVFVVHTMNYVVADGSSNWMEGFILICASFSPPLLVFCGSSDIQSSLSGFYVIIAISFWFYPGELCLLARRLLIGDPSLLPRSCSRNRFEPGQRPGRMPLRILDLRPRLALALVDCVPPAFVRLLYLLTISCNLELHQSL